MRYKCTGCSAVYGEGTNKPHNGYCEACWWKHLEACKANSDKLMAEWNARPLPAAMAQPIKYPYKRHWFGFRFFVRQLADIINVKVCRLLGIPVRKYILPRIRIRISISRDD